MKILHVENSSNNYAFQEIGQLSSGRKSTSSLKSAPTKGRGEFSSQWNASNNGANQHLYAPDDPNSIATYQGNLSNTGGTQNLGMDVGMDISVHKFRKWRRSRK